MKNNFKMKKDVLSLIAFILKILLTFPLFLWFHLRLFFKYRKKKKKPESCNEESNYRWVKGYSRYLFWLYGYKSKVLEPNLWNAKPVFIIADTLHSIYPLLLLKVNDFNVNPPILFLFTKSFLNSLSKTLFKFYSLINIVTFDLQNDEPTLFIVDGTEKIQIPRSVFTFLPTLKVQKWYKLLDIAWGGFAQVLFIKLHLNGRKITLKMEKLFTPKEVIKMNQQMLIARLENL